MEKRLYFIVGDILATIVVGALVGLAAAAATPTGWNMLLAMFVGMAIGMLLALPGSFAFMPLFGAMETMVPAMLSGMLAGMWVAMAAAMRPVASGEALALGAATGVFVFVLTYAINAWFRRGPSAAAMAKGDG